MDAEMEEVRRLYLVFKKSLFDRDIEKFYDEVDLLNIYDYAVDENDLMVQFEILRLARQLFPESSDFGVRNAYFMKEVLDEQEGARAIAAQHKNETFGWQILNLSFEIDSDKVIAGIESALSGVSQLEDDDVLRLIDLCDDAGIQEWLYNNHKRILEKTGFPDTFLMELSEVFFNNGEFGRTIELLEELTELQPFNATVWSRLADIQAIDKNLDSALSSLDYAIAIEPENPGYRVQRVKLKYYCGAVSAKDIQQLKAILEKHPENTEALNIFFAITVDNGEYTKAIDMLKENLQNCNDNARGVDIAEKIFLLNNRPVVNEIIRDYFVSGKLHVPDKLEWAERLFINGCYAACAEVIISYIGKPVERKSWDLLFESLYKIKDYTGLAELFVNPEYGIRENYKEAEEPLFPLFILSLALIRTDHNSEFCELALFLLENQSNISDNFRERLALSAAYTVLHALLHFINNGTEFDINNFDPFTD